MSIAPRPPADASPLEIRMWKAEWRLTVIEESLVAHGVSAATHPSLRHDVATALEEVPEPLPEASDSTVAEPTPVTGPTHPTPTQEPADVHEATPPQLAATTQPTPAAVAPAPATLQHTASASPHVAATANAPVKSSSAQLEQWIGVRGAAVLGGAVLALATIYLFKFTIDKGLITPAVRLLLGGVTSITAIGLSETIVRKRFAPLADPLAGAGITGAYATLWAGTSLLGLISPAVSFVAMGGVTVFAGLLSIRHRSLTIAVLGLAGGFLTPVLVSTGESRPLVLFLYLFLLNLGVLAVSKQQRWVVLPVLAFIGTAAYQFLFVTLGMSATWAWLGFLTTAAFAGLFAFAPLAKNADDAPTTAVTLFRSAVLLFAFLLTAILSPIIHGFVPFEATLALVVLLLVAGHAVALQHQQPLVAGLFTIIATLLTGFHLLVWSRTGESRPETLRWAIEATALLVFVPSVAILRTLLLRRQENVSSNLWSFWLSAFCGGLCLVQCGAVQVIPGGVLLTGAVALLALSWVTLFGIRPALEKSSSLTREPALALVITSVMPFGFVAMYQAWGAGPLGVSALAIAVVANLVTLLLAPRLAVSDEDGKAHGRSGAEHGVAVGFVAACFPFLMSDPSNASLTLFLGWCALTVLVAVRQRAPAWLLAASIAATAAGLRAFTDIAPLLGGALLFGILLLTFTVSLWGPLRASRLAAWSASISALLFFFPILLSLGDAGWLDFLQEEKAAALIAALLAVVPASAALLSWRRSQAGDAHAVSQLAAFLTGSCVLVSLALLLALPLHWFATALILEGLTLIFAARSLGLRQATTELVGTGLAFVGTLVLLVRLVADGDATVYFDFVSCYGVATLLLAAAAYCIDTRLGQEGSEGLGGLSRAALFTLMGAAMTLGFALVTEAVIRPFGAQTGPGPNLAISLAWAVYALLLLAVGMLTGRRFPRAVSLALLLFTCGKVFIYDLAYLKDLYRVASLTGLAFALMGVSVIYQRFVFRKSGSKSDENQPRTP